MFPYLLLIIVVLILLYFLANKRIEHYLFPYFYHPRPQWYYPRSTRNMSYDLRGDVPIYRHSVGPWMQSTIGF